MHNCCTLKSSFVVLKWQITWYIYSFRAWKHGLENHSFIHLSCITIATQNVFLSKFFIKIIMFETCTPSVLKSLLNCTFCHNVPNGCCKFCTKLYFFATMSQMGIAYSALKIFWAFLTFSQFSLAYPVLKFWGNWKKNQKSFRVKDNLTVLP